MVQYKPRDAHHLNYTELASPLSNNNYTVTGKWSSTSQGMLTTSTTLNYLAFSTTASLSQVTFNKKIKDNANEFILLMTQIKITSLVNFIIRIVKTFFMNVFVSNSSIMKRNINTIRKKLNIKFDDLLKLNKKALRIEFEKNNTTADWRVNMIQELLSIRENQLECEL